MPRILLLLPTSTYRATDFVTAAARVGAEVVIGSERRQALAGPMGDRAVVVPLAHHDASVDAIVALHRRAPLDAVVAVDDQGVVIAASAAQRLGLRHNPPDAVAATRDKAVMRARLTAGSVPQPEHRTVAPGASIASAADEIGYPCVVKPITRSGSQGVIRADDPAAAEAAGRRIRALPGDDGEVLLVERFVPGTEVAVEGLLRSGRLEMLAVFDKPDPLDGPFFEETIYVTPSRQPASVIASLRSVTAQAATALGLREGPIHAELRVGDDATVAIIEVAARSIGGLCARSLRFGAGISLEEIIVAHALGVAAPAPEREAQASGVMMLPIRAGGTLDRVEGQERALAVEGVVGVEITVTPGRPLVPLPEGDRYLGFVFARGPSPAEVEAALRKADACLEVRLR